MNKKLKDIIVVLGGVNGSELLLFFILEIVIFEFELK